MRKAILAAALVIGAMSPAYAADLAADPRTANAACCPARGGLNSAEDQPVADTLKRFPAGGPDLAQALTDLIETNPERARAIVIFGRTAALGDKATIGAALAAAYTALQQPSPQRAAMVQGALGCADAGLRNAYRAHGAPLGQTRSSASCCPGALTPALTGNGERAVQDAARRFTTGGPELARSLAALIMRDPAIAQAVVALARGGNADIKLAAALALAAAVNGLENSNSAETLAVEAAAACADDQTRKIYEDALGSDDAANDAQDQRRRGIYSGYFNPDRPSGGRPVSAN